MGARQVPWRMGVGVTDAWSWVTYGSANSSDGASRATVCGHEVELFDRTLRDNDLVRDGREPDRLDVHAELVGPEGGQGLVGSALGRGAYHIVRGGLRLLDRIAPVFDRDELAVVEWVGPARHVPGDKDIVGDHTVGVEG